MLLSILLFLPAAACLFWMLVFAMTASRTSTLGVLEALLFCLAVALATDAAYSSPQFSFLQRSQITILSQFASPCVPAVLLMYLRKVRYRADFAPKAFIWLIIPIALFSGTFLLSSTIGLEKIAAFMERLYEEGYPVVESHRGSPLAAYFWWAFVTYRLIMIGGALYLFVYCVVKRRKDKFSVRHLPGFLKEGLSLWIIELLSLLTMVFVLLLLVKLSIPWRILQNHPWIALLFAALFLALLFAFCFTALFSARDYVTREAMGRVMRYNYDETTKGEVVEAMIGDLLEDAEDEALNRIHERIGRNLKAVDLPQAKEEDSTLAGNLFTAVANSWDDDSLLSRFQNVMLNERLFLQPGLSLSDVADKLHTNKTYISKMVNNTYNVGFPELLNILRVDYAEQYILNHRHAKQSEIAQACGFVSASSFNMIFKKVAGVTPKVWLAGHEDKESR